MIPPIPPVTRSEINLISVSKDTGSSLFVSPVIVTSIKIAKPVIKPTTSPADFVILLVINPPEKAPSDSKVSVIYFVSSVGNKPLVITIAEKIQVRITVTNSPQTVPKSTALISNFLSDKKTPPKIIC